MKSSFSTSRGGSKILALINVLAVLIVLGTTGYFLREQIGATYQNIINQLIPCAQPIAYSIGTFDARFGISKENFLNALNQAEQIWEAPIQKNLFDRTENGALKINLIYDERQDATVKLQKAGIEVHDDRASYDALNTKYVSLLRTYQTKKVELDAAVAAFERENQAFAQEVARWNKRNGTQVEYDRLQQKSADLKAQANQLQSMQDALNKLADTINDIVVTLNRLAAQLNLTVEKYNTIGASQSGEFEQGTYTDDENGRQITIYQYEDHIKLVRVLAHEMGHALGLDHVEDSASMMYRLNQGTTEKLSVADIAALKQRCFIK